VHVLSSICSNVKIAVRLSICDGSRFISAMSVRLPTCDGSQFLSAMAIVPIQDFVLNNMFCYFSQRSICFVDVPGFKQVKLHMS
jgi:hypothetical protein